MRREKKFKTIRLFENYSTELAKGIKKLNEPKDAFLLNILLLEDFRSSKPPNK